MLLRNEPQRPSRCLPIDADREVEAFIAQHDAILAQRLEQPIDVGSPDCFRIEPPCAGLSANPEHAEQGLTETHRVRREVLGFRHQRRIPAEGADVEIRRDGDLILDHAHNVR